tara:strand:- start:589 stop:1923 length:1335 start_codon:yes stop_codon:yes gene_type:complete
MYKNKKIALIFFARTNSKRLKNKLFKKILNKSIISHSINLTRNLKIVDEKVMATTQGKKDDKIVNLAKKKNLRIYRGSENNVLERMYYAYKSLKIKPDILIRFCCENPITSSEIIKKYIKRIIDKKLDLISVVKPSNLLFGIAPIILSSKALEKIYKKAKNDVYKEHVETYCYDNAKMFKIDYIKEKKDYFFPDTGLSIDTNEDYQRVKKVFKISKLKNYIYNFKKIIKYHSKSKIYIKNLKLRKYFTENYKNFFYTKNKKTADIIIDFGIKNYKKNNNKLYLDLKKIKDKILFSFVKNGNFYKLIQIKNYPNLNNYDYIKLFFDTLIKKSFFWPPLPLEDLTSNSEYVKVLKKKLYRKKDEYFPKQIVFNKNISLKKDLIKKKIVSNIKFRKMINQEKKKIKKNKIFVFNGYFVYIVGRKLIKITKFDILKIVSVWRSHEYSI